MGRRPIHLPSWRLAGLFALTLLGCNAILGVDQDYVVGDTTASGTAAGGDGLAGGQGGSGLGGTGGTSLGGGGSGGVTTGGSGTGLGGGLQTIDVQVENGGDDVEECLVPGDHCATAGAIYDYSTDLELVDDPPWAGPQVVGIRFLQLGIPQGAIITAAYLEFVADTSNSLATSLSIEGEAADSAPPFSAAVGDVSNRPRTNASVAWAPAGWTEGDTYQTASVVSIVQELVNRAGWSTSSSAVFIFTGNGTRIAESYEGDPQSAALLHVEFNP